MLPCFFFGDKGRETRPLHFGFKSGLFTLLLQAFLNSDSLARNIVNVPFDGMAFGSDAVHLQVFHNFLQRNGVVFIGSLLEDVPYQERFEFLPIKDENAF